MGIKWEMKSLDWRKYNLLALLLPWMAQNIGW